MDSGHPSGVLSASSLRRLISSSLPRSSDGMIKSGTEAIALACHSGFLAVGFRLVGLGEDHTIEASSTSDEAKPLPPEWNSFPTPAFRYKHTQSSMEYVLKVSRLGNKTLIIGMGMGDDKVMSLDLTTKDYISESTLPLSNFSTVSEDDIQNMFISSNRLSDLGSLLRINVLQKLIPGLQKEGYEESARNTESTNQQTNEAQRDARTIGPSHGSRLDPLRGDDVPRPSAGLQPLADPLAAPRRPRPIADFPPPGFEDEYEMNGPSRFTAPIPGRLPGYGESDLYPPGLGPNDPLRVGGIGPGIRGGGHGGMHPTFDDPMFGGGRGSYQEGYNPQAPPGARYDPVGPGSRPPRGSGGGFSRGSGGPPNPFSGFGSGDFV